MEFQELAKACGEAFGKPALAPDETGICRIDADGIEVTVGENAARGLVVFRCTAGALPTNGTARFRRAMLHANFMGRNTAGAQLAVSAKDEIVLQQTLSLAFTDGETAVTQIRLLAGMAGQWRKLVADYEPVAVRQEAEAEEERKLVRRMIASSFLRV